MKMVNTDWFRTEGILQNIFHGEYESIKNDRKSQRSHWDILIGYKLVGSKLYYGNP